MDEASTRRVTFRPRARLLSLLGEQLISDQTVGLLELVKNAYDADATRVEIELMNLARAETTRVVVHDNGFGMTRDDVEQKWFSPAISSKERQKKANQRTPLGRLPIGEKGVGRFAVQQLGHTFQLISRSLDKPEIVVEINWDDFDEEDSYLADIGVVLYEREPLLFTNNSTGTTLIIEHARSQWREQLVARVQRALRRLQSPHQGQAKIDFHIVFHCPDFPIYENISNSDILERAHYVFEGLVTDVGILDYEYTCHHPAVPERSITVDNYNLIPAAKHEMQLGGRNNSGPFYLNFYVWDRTQEYLNQSGVSRADLDAMAGVSIFRDRLRVLPYGEPGNDWLDLDKERINAPADRIGNQQTIGFVEVFQENTPELKDKTNREGLIDNAAFRDLRALVRASINVFISQWLYDRQQMGKRSKGNRREPSKDSLHKAQTLAEQVTVTARDDIIVVVDNPLSPQSTLQDISMSLAGEQFASPTTGQEISSLNPLLLPPNSGVIGQELTQRQAMHQIVNHLKEAVTYHEKSTSEEEQRTQMLMHLAATGMAAERVVHEFGRQVNAAMQTLKTLHHLTRSNSEIAEAVRTLDTCMGTLRNEFRVLAPYETGWRLQRTRPQSVREAVAIALKLNEYLMSINNITITVEGDDFEVVARSASLVQVLDNLIHNACLWLESVTNARSISITINRQEYTIVVADTGPGVPLHMRESIFRPFVSLRNGSRGLGLYITQELLRTMNGSIHLEEPDAFKQGATFLLQFSRQHEADSTSESTL